MEKNYKIQYEPPVFEVVDVRAEGIICTSGLFTGLGEEEIWSVSIL